MAMIKECEEFYADNETVWERLGEISPEGFSVTAEMSCPMPEEVRRLMVGPRMIRLRIPMRIPTVTHNELVIRKRGKGRFIGKSDALLEAEERIRANLASRLPRMDGPLEGPLMATVTYRFATDGKHAQMEPHTEKPDGDNLVKTLWDVLQGLGVIADDCRIADQRIVKVWADPPGVQLEVREIGGRGWQR